MHMHHIFSLDGQFCAITNKFVTRIRGILKLDRVQFFPRGSHRRVKMKTPMA